MFNNYTAKLRIRIKTNNMGYNNLIQIAKYLEEYESINKNKDTDLESFTYWLADKISTKPRSYKAIDKIDSNAIQQQSIDVQIGILIGRMSKYARVYSKKVLKDTGLSGLDDYTFMATLMFKPSLTKSELTHHNLMDSATSGADIIKRLIKHEYIEAFNDENDKRSIRVRITDHGKNKMFEVFHKMDMVSDIITGNLDSNEKLYLLGYLRKLDHIHQDIYTNDRKNDLETIKDKYIDTQTKGI